MICSVMLSSPASFCGHCNRWGLIVCVSKWVGEKGALIYRTYESLGPRDHLITHTKPKATLDWLSQTGYDATPKNLIFRELRVSKAEGAKGKMLITTVCCPKRYKKADLKILYQQRWHVELNFQHIKQHWEWMY